MAIRLNNLATLLHATNRLAEAEPLMRRALANFLAFTQATGHEHPRLRAAHVNYVGLLTALGRSEVEARVEIRALGASFGVLL